MALRISICAAVLVANLSSVMAAEALSEMPSPHGDYTIRILDKKLPGADFYFGDQTIALYHGRKLLSQFPTTGYLLQAYWSANGSFVAVNNRRGHEGDYLWVFSLRDGKAVRKPDDKLGDPKSFVPRITKRFADCTEDSLFRYYLIAMGWHAPNELKVRTDVRFYRTKLSDVLIDDVYAVSEHSFKLIRESLGPAPPDA